MGRPKKEIDVELLKKAAAIHCTWHEICSLVGASRRTLEDRFSHIIEEARSNGKMSLRRKQFQMALDGNVPLLIWLGKTVLGQSEKVEHNLITSQEPQKVLSKDEVVEIVRAARS